ncbi:hypothetical protein [uncultured Clostridium sp.]|uniref:hypothetical protein n=1 Tax=uncultured Clostridium sp. TaxID=59620 RepID=UPI003217426D
MKITLNNPSIKTYGYKNKKQNLEEKFFKITKEISSKNNELNIPGNSKIEYVLECGIIKIYIIDGKNQRKCIKSIPAKCAPKELLAMVKCQTIADALYIKDLMKLEDDSNKKVSEYVSNAKDDLMDNYDSIPYLRSLDILNKDHGKSK